MTNQMKLEFVSKSINEGFARVAIAAFMAGMNPTLEEVADVKTAVSEAVTNAIIHGYPEEEGTVVMTAEIQDNLLQITILDEGKGMLNVGRAMEPLYTSRPDLERSGMGFAFMQAFMDTLTVESGPGVGTRVHMTKKLNEVNLIKDGVNERLNCLD